MIEAEVVATDDNITSRAERAARAENIHATDCSPVALEVYQLEQETSMFLFFSNRVGCLGSLLISVALTLLVLAVLGVF